MEKATFRFIHKTIYWQQNLQIVKIQYINNKQANKQTEEIYNKKTTVKKNKKVIEKYPGPGQTVYVLQRDH